MLGSKFVMFENLKEREKLLVDEEWSETSKDVEKGLYFYEKCVESSQKHNLPTEVVINVVLKELFTTVNKQSREIASIRKELKNHRLNNSIKVQPKFENSLGVEIRKIQPTTKDSLRKTKDKKVQ